MKKSKEEIKEGLETDICGVELEHNHVIQCKKNLDTLVEVYGIKDVLWNITEGDYLRLQLDRQFHFVIGTPRILYIGILKKLKGDFKKILI